VPSKVYKPNVKAAILKAAVNARKAGKKWPEALQAAKAAAYRGGLVSLILFGKGKRKRARRAAAKATTAKAPAQAAGKGDGIIRGDRSPIGPHNCRLIPCLIPGDALG